MSKFQEIIGRLLSSVLNSAVAFAASLPLGFIWGFSFRWRVSVIIIFFLYMFLITLLDKRSLGMSVSGVYYAKNYSFFKKLFYRILYTLSFATLLIWVWFPFDLFLINMLLIQLPSILLTGFTIHELLAGKIQFIRKRL